MLQPLQLKNINWFYSLRQGFLWKPNPNISDLQNAMAPEKIAHTWWNVSSKCQAALHKYTSQEPGLVPCSIPSYGSHRCRSNLRPRTQSALHPKTSENSRTAAVWLQLMQLFDANALTRTEPKCWPTRKLQTPVSYGVLTYNEAVVEFETSKIDAFGNLSRCMWCSELWYQL